MGYFIELSFDVLKSDNFLKTKHMIVELAEKYGKEFHYNNHEIMGKNRVIYRNHYIMSFLFGENEEEVAKFASNNNVRPKDLLKLPKLRPDDAMVKFYRGNYGDIFKMIRKNINDKSLLKEQIIFRIVTANIAKKK